MSLRTLREQRGISRDELARKLGVASSTIYRWEQGLAGPRLRYIRPIADALGIETRDVLAAVEYKP